MECLARSRGEERETEAKGREERKGVGREGGGGGILMEEEMKRISSFFAIDDEKVGTQS